MVTSDDPIPAAASVQPTHNQLRDTSRFPNMFALLAARIDRPGTIARASPALCFFFDRSTRNPLSFQTISTAAFDVLALYAKWDGSALFTRLFIHRRFSPFSFAVFPFNSVCIASIYFPFRLLYTNALFINLMVNLSLSSYDVASFAFTNRRVLRFYRKRPLRRM